MYATENNANINISLYIKHSCAYRLILLNPVKSMERGNRVHGATYWCGSMAENKANLQRTHLAPPLHWLVFPREIGIGIRGVRYSLDRSPVYYRANLERQTTMLTQLI